MLLIMLFAAYLFVGWRRGLRTSAWAVGLGALIPWLAYGVIVLWGWLDDGLQGQSSRFAVGAGLVMVGVAGSLTWLVVSSAGAGLGLLIRRWTHKSPKSV